MSNITHFKVLLKKNFLTLKRKWGFALFFILLPIVTLGVFALVKIVISDGTREEGHNFDYLYFSSTRNITEDKNPYFSDTNITAYTSFARCKYSGYNEYAIVGNTKERQQFMNSTIFSNLTSMGFTGGQFTDTNDLYDIIRTEQTSTYCFGLQIDKFDLVKDDYDIQVMWMKKDIPDTNAASYDISVRTPDITNWKKYNTSGFMGIYQIIVNNILEQKSLSASLDVAYMPIKTPSYLIVNPTLQTQLSKLFPFFFMFTFLIPLYYLVTKLAEERESKAREGMKMMGLQDSSYIVSWFVFYLIICIVMSIIITITVSINIFPNSNKLLIFFLALFYGMSLFGFALTLVAILPNTRGSATAATLLHIITYFIAFAITDDYATGLKFPLCLIPNVGMSISIVNLYHFEAESNGLTMSTAGLWYQNMTYYAAFFMLLFDVVYLLCLGLYLDQILSSQFGVPKKWYFLCTKGFWCRKKNLKQSTLEGGDEKRSLINCCESFEDDIKNPEDFENIPEALKRQEFTNECLKISCLRKTFGDKVAVDNTNISMYNGQIFALLGHNGAGKTTTISMLTGLLQATKGKATAFGLDIFEEMEDFRKVLGVCPQHDVLFEYLTPKEHLELFAAFKGTPANEVEQVVNKMLHDIDLLGQKDQLAKTLSGGQKRKLSVGIAMIGNSKVIILDEPSSGMDTSSRRRLWEMLKQSKNGRIIILTTHYMDEADILGDRICIMADGKLKCCGSSLFLKNRFGSGYNLVIAKKNRLPSPAIDEFVHSNIQNAKKLQEVSSETAFQLPSESIQYFREFFNKLDQNLDQLDIRSYGIGITTLEEVFLRIAKGDKELEGDDDELKRFTLKDSKNKITGDFNAQELAETEEYSVAEQHEEGFLNVFMLNLGALMKKKLLLQIRDPRNLVIEIVFPIVFIFVGLALSQVKVFKDGRAKVLSPDQFPTPSHLTYNDPVPRGGNASYFTEEYFSSSIWDTGRNVSIDVPDIKSSGDYYSMVSQYDDYLYDTQGKLANPIYGDYFFYNLNGSSDNKYAAILLANSTSQDAVATYGAYIHEVFLQNVTGNKDLKFKITSQPFPITLKEQGVAAAASGTTVSIVIAVAYMMVSDSLIQNIIRERRQNVKHQMIISGASLPAYWVSHYLIDIIFQAPPSICAIIGIKLFDLDFPYLWVIIVVFILANPVFIYAMSCLFDSDSSGSITIRMLYLLVGCILPIGIQFLLIIDSTKSFGAIFKWFFYILPIYSLNQGVGLIANRDIMAYLEGVSALDPLSMEIGGPSVIFLTIDIFLYWFILAVYENKIVQRLIRGRVRVAEDQDSDNHMVDGQQVDEDIIEEEKRVAIADSSTMTIKVDKIKKSYGKVEAVKRISFGLEYGECFALLGVSGAGKTTTFKCLTGEEMPSYGIVNVNNFDVTTRRGFDQARRQIGYCPQFDAIFGRLTVREHLEFYSKVKGIIVAQRQKLVEKTLDEMDLREFEKVHAENLSGGNKRKLSVAMALIGNPPIILLDEPSTGVDPKAKRFMWTIVSKISTQRKKSSVIITTHSMEEAEALCTKMGIMVAGRFKCFGSSQHIKAKYGTGYELELKVKYLKEEDLAEVKEQLGLQNFEARVSKDDADIILQKFEAQYLQVEISKDGNGSDFFNDFEGAEQTVDTDSFIRWVFTETRGGQIVEKFEQLFSSSELIEHYNTSYKFKVSKDSHTIGFLFGMMEDIKSEFSISEYSVSQTTLEQIFNTFAKEAEIGNERKKTHVARKSEKKSNGEFRLKSEKAHDN